ncbi:MAG: hypothetical protein RLZZ333_1923, partial [Bacteroidota bacterium]
FGEHADESAPALTMSIVAVGTPDFVAPEALDPDRKPPECSRGDPEF